MIAVAQAPVSPAVPKKTVVGIAAISAGLFLGLASALFAEGTSPQTAPTSPGFDDQEVPVAAQRRRQRYWDDDDDEWRA